ncbi:permease [Chondromyces apiculatus]|uniref:Uncharacterized protein n=1 Tax=Chondromyces apiculatus DSM 436 TaxID=1192034 RepID=A0A017TBX9_9BACT|nr:permease [Chondromyces apiculatus]EYF06325.1 Hypothetical protein CAP_2203 [Chondromyces apiculatus DSM 436]
MLLLALALSIGGLAVGPLLAVLGRGRAVALAAMEGLTLGLLPALLLVRHLPHVAEEIGAVVAIGAMASGYVGLRLVERWSHVASERVGRGLIVVALAMHAFTDGAGLALATAAAEQGSAEGVLLGLALLVHRMPEGLFLVTTLLPELGWGRTLARLGVVALATIVGAIAGERALSVVPHGVFEGFVAVGLGAMLAMALHPHSVAPSTRPARRAGAIAFLVGVAAAVAVPEPAEHLVEAHPRELSVIQSLGPLFVETAPSLLLGLVGAALLHTYLKQRSTASLRGGSAPVQAARGMVFGLPLSLGVNDVLPMSRRMLVAGVPTAAVIAFAIGAPELDVGSAALSVRLLGVPLTAVRLIGSAALILVVALLVAAVARRRAEETVAPTDATDAAAGADAATGADAAAGAEPLAAAAPPPFAGSRLRAILADACGPTLDRVAAWYVVGLLLAAIVEATFDPEIALGLPPPHDVVVSALAAIPLYISAQGATPLAAVMIHKGFSVGAALAFLVVGPATNIAMLALLRRHLGLGATAMFVLGSAGCGALLGLLANFLVPAATAPEVHALVAHEHAVLEWVATGILAALLLGSLLRLGPRGWFSTMTVERQWPLRGEADDPRHPHDHGHDHGHHRAHAEEAAPPRGQGEEGLSEEPPPPHPQRRIA